MRYFFQLGLMVSLVSPSYSFSQPHWETFLSLQDRAAPVNCNKPPLPGEGPEDDNLRFSDFRQVAKFLKSVGGYVYKFDQEYLNGMAESIEKSEHPDLMAIFIMNAVEPYLSSLGYTEIRRRYIDVAMENLRCLNKVFGISDLSSLKNMQIFQEGGVRFLTKSLHSARSMMSENQKRIASDLVQFLGEMIAQGLTEKTLSEVRLRLKDIQSLELALVQNPFLRSRAAADVKVIQFLED